MAETTRGSAAERLRRFTYEVGDVEFAAPDLSIPPILTPEQLALGRQTLRKLMEDRATVPIILDLNRDDDRDEPAPAEDAVLGGFDATWQESEHPRGQPENKGEFAEKGVSGGTSGQPGEQRGAPPAHPGAAPGAEPRGSPGSGPVPRMGSGVRAVHEPSAFAREALGNIGAPAYPLNELGEGGGQVFHDSLLASKIGKWAPAVTVHAPDEYENMRTFLTPGGKAGFALNGDEIVSVFRQPDGPPNVLPSLMTMAIEEGGRRLDCFDTLLPVLYANRGFRAVARIPFDDDYRPPDWNYVTFKGFNGGRPDVVFMVYDPEHAQSYANTDGVRAANWDAAAALQKAAVERLKAPEAPSTA